MRRNIHREVLLQCERCKINVEIYIIQLLRQRAPALPRAKIEVSSISDADHTASPASPISSLVYPCG